MRSSAARAYTLLFFLSGATGLVYELLWVRLLYQAFGSTIQSVTTVVAAYMGGLGLGAWWLGRRADRHPQPAALYGWLEIAIGVFGVLSPFVLDLARRVYIASARTFALGGTASVAVRFGLAALVLLVPTTLMGGTLPVLTRAFVGGERERLRQALGRLYGLNTLGAVVGTALAGFALIEFVGVRFSLWGTAAVNLGLGAVALTLAGRLEPPPDPRPASAPAADPQTPPRVRPEALRRWAMVLLALTAFASLLDEIAWTRVLVMVVGGSTYAFTLVLLAFLLGIGLGSTLVARYRAGRPATPADAAVAQGITGAGAALLILFFAVLPSYVMAVFERADLGATTRLVLLGLAVGAVVVVPAIGMGLSFPLLADLAAPRDRARGGDVGVAYALNTLGSIAGAVLAGFVFVVAFGTETTIRFGLVINGLAALGLAALAARGVRERSAEHRALQAPVLIAGALASVTLGVALGVPGWSSRLIDLGPAIYGRQLATPAARRAFLEHRGFRQLAFREGWNATVSVWESLTGRTLRLNGKVDASDQGDMDTQIMLGLAPAAARPRARSAVVIGFGSGVTSRVLAAVPGMERVRVVELEPAVLEMSHWFEGVNAGVLRRPTVSAVLDDARSALQLEPERADVIVSEPSNPWVAGVATLYTPEFFETVRRRLSDDGVFCQWVQLYQLPLPVVAGVVANLRAVFPHVEVWFSTDLDLMVLASAQPLRYDRAWLSELLAPGTELRGLAHEWLGVDSVGDHFGRRLLGEAGTARLAARASLTHRDDRPRLEFVAARRFLDQVWDARVFDSLAAIGSSAGEVPGTSPALFARAMTAARTLATALELSRAAHDAAPADPVWIGRLAWARMRMGDTTFADSAIPRALARSRHPELLRIAAVLAARRGDTTLRVALLREVLARGGDSAEAEAGLAALAARAGRWREAVPELGEALARGRGTYRHPWPTPGLRDALTALAFAGPPPLADSVLGVAIAARPGWATLYELRAGAALRAGRCDEAATLFLTLVTFGIEPPDAPLQVGRCERGLAYAPR
ncbi:MAG TPA: fused MFS/spermidine synthase [Gemmatimonadales bacterium]|nr:fused MFS/spermidine synthase [Gemmatimonadales bacterium]